LAIALTTTNGPLARAGLNDGGHAPMARGVSPEVPPISSQIIVVASWLD